jgi:hypothetical protein
MAKYISKSEAKRCMKKISKYASQEAGAGAKKIKKSSKKLYGKLKLKSKKLFK